ncbi:C40 family peptidase [Angustibacter aerolatus]
MGVLLPQSVSTAPKAHAAVSAKVGAKALTLVATRKGAKYKMGAVGPRAFDCSGLTKWTYARLGKTLPHNAQAQWKATKHLKKSDRRVGDLVFFFSGKHAYHVAVYAGHGRIWHAPKPGSRVKLAKLWTSKVKYARVR